MVYWVREHDIVILSVGLRKKLAAYEEAEKALRQPLPPPPGVNPTQK
jgi:hypothetical protein